jgi:hypothetical protein
MAIQLADMAIPLQDRFRGSVSGSVSMALAVSGQPLSVSFAFFLYYQRQTKMNLQQIFF